MIGRLRGVWDVAWMYLRLCVSLLPMVTPPSTPSLDSNAVDDAYTGEQADITVILVEARRALDDALASIDKLRGRAQVGVTTSIVLLGVYGALGGDEYNWLWKFGVVVLLVGLGGMLATLVVPVDVTVMHPVPVAKLKSPIDQSLVPEYQHACIDTQNTANMLLTVFAVASKAICASAILAGWLWYNVHA